MRIADLFSLFLLTSALLLKSGEGSIIGGFVIPHGDFAFDPSLIHFKEPSSAINRGCHRVAEDIARAKPDIVFLSTPHGLELQSSFALYINSKAAGFATLGQDLPPPHPGAYRVDLKDLQIAHKESLDLMKYLTTEEHHSNSDRTNQEQYIKAKQKFKIDALYGFADSEPVSLRWGEIIPLSFILNATNYLHKNKNKGNETLSSFSSSSAPIRWMFFSQPARRYTDSAQMVPELVELGREIYSFLNELPERVAVVISSDLAHTHEKDGPYGYSPQAQPFDQHVRDWAKHLAGDSLLVHARKIASEAQSCGYTGLVMLHGMLQKHAMHFVSKNGKRPSHWEDALKSLDGKPAMYSISQYASRFSGAIMRMFHSLVGRKSEEGERVVLHSEFLESHLRNAWVSTVHGWGHPGYYGMMAASFLPRDASTNSK